MNKTVLTVWVVVLGCDLKLFNPFPHRDLRLGLVVADAYSLDASKIKESEDHTAHRFFRFVWSLSLEKSCVRTNAIERISRSAAVS
jgi:hypothetical protein